MAFSSELIILLTKKLEQLLNLPRPFQITSKSNRLSFGQWSRAMKPGATETVQSLFWKQLRMIPGITHNVCDALIKSHPTPASLLARIQQESLSLFHVDA
eukprot:Gregarina_sp_Poly_1__3878@NODE_215_length_11293_cov_58_142259_g191_i0_p13_GENE_NODE_215_length_11293_cov_58_142259_g191_i0NODE_215_length_11293_cov_58_142259_g191_i0_p13_ORF_typecomplete_len100_score8_74_NODE_215_length_11293_cov_58_142259_g191_i061146413